MTDIRETLGEAGLEHVLLADGFDDAAIGVVERCGQEDIGRAILAVENASQQGGQP